MPQSMTGFANQSVAVGEWNLSLECKSVNSRFLDLTLKLPDAVKRSEPTLRQLVSEKLVRGKVELAIRLERSEGGPEATLNLTKLSDMKAASWRVSEILKCSALHRFPTACLRFFAEKVRGGSLQSMECYRAQLEPEWPERRPGESSLAEP